MSHPPGVLLGFAQLSFSPEWPGWSAQRHLYSWRQRNGILYARYSICSVWNHAEQKAK